MRILKYIMAICFTVVLTFSCTENFEEINQSPNSPTTIPSSLLIADILKSGMDNMYSTFVGGDMGSCWAQHWAKVQYNDEERYSPRQTVIESVWDVFYEDFVSDARTVELLAIDEGNPAVQGVGLVLQAYGYSILTDMFGDIPVTEAIQATNGNFTPAYDPQSVVYDSIFAKLDRANDLLTMGGTINASFDVLYHGDANAWRKFANSLKVRAMMRISATDGFSASELQEAVDRGIFTSNADEAKLVYLDAQPSANPIYETIVFGNRGEFKVSEVLVSTLEGLNDPRLPVYAQENADGEYRGKPAGIRDVPNDDYNYNNVSPIGTLYLEATAPAYLVSYAELQFLLAEAAENGYISGDAATYYAAGVSASMEANGITSGVDGYLSQVTVAYSSANSEELIGTQKWLALYCQGLEAWTEWRRTGYPVLNPAIEANPSVGEIPSRFTYPATEQTTNKVAYEAAVARQGVDRLTTSIWWAQ